LWIKIKFCISEDGGRPRTTINHWWITRVIIVTNCRGSKLNSVITKWRNVTIVSIPRIIYSRTTTEPIRRIKRTLW